MKSRLLSLLLLLLCTASSAQSTYTPTAENLQNRAAFQDDKFGLFIHWGIYSMMADGEWVMNDREIQGEEYAKLASGFYPARFDAREWVAAVKDAGMRYITITSRHHDGFSMWDTECSAYNIVDATPFKRDVLKELAEACEEQGIKLHFYYSHLDWHHRDYYPRGPRGHAAGRPDEGNWQAYLDFMNAQLTELLTNYGEIGAIWFDGWWDKKWEGDWQLERQYRVIHDLQPGCLIGNNHHEAPFEGEDFQMFEKDLPGQNTSGYSEAGVVSDVLPLEMCETMNGMWGYRNTDQNYKSADELIQLLVKAAGNNSNLLINVGPEPSGVIPALALDRLRQMGVWMRRYGETIYGTRAGIIAPRDWGVTTQKENKLFVHILNLQDEALFLPLTQQRVKRAVRLSDGAAVRFVQDKEGVLLKLGEVPISVDYIVQLEF